MLSLRQGGGLHEEVTGANCLCALGYPSGLGDLADRNRTPLTSLLVLLALGGLVLAQVVVMASLQCEPHGRYGRGSAHGTCMCACWGFQVIL